MKIENVTHTHLRRILEDNYDFVRNEGEISDEDFELIMYELFYSLLISPTTSRNGEIFPVLIGDDNRNIFLPLFTDLAEYRKVFGFDDDIHPVVYDFDGYMNLGIEGIVINPTCEQFSFSSKAFRDKKRTPLPQFNITDETLDADGLKNLLNQKSALDLAAAYDYDEFFRSLADSFMFASVKRTDLPDSPDGIIRLDSSTPVMVSDEGYLELYTATDEMGESDRYASVVNLDQFMDYLIRMDYNGIIINPKSDAVVVERNVLLTNFDEFRKNYNSSKYAKACEYAFII